MSKNCKELIGEAAVGLVNFAGHGVERSGLVIVLDRPPLGIRDHILHGRNRQALAHARPLVNFLVFASGKCDSFDDLLYILRNMQLVPVALGPGFLAW